jgi:hypothetical protein
VKNALCTKLRTKQNQHITFILFGCCSQVVARNRKIKVGRAAESDTSNTILLKNDVTMVNDRAGQTE